MKKVVGCGVIVFATAILLSGCSGGDIAGEARDEAERSVSLGVDYLAKSYAGAVVKTSIGAKLTSDQLSQIGVPLLADRQTAPSTSPAPFTPGVGTAVLFESSGTGEVSSISFWIYQSVLKSSSFVSLSVEIYGCGRLDIDRTRLVRLHNVPCPSWAAVWDGGGAELVSLEEILKVNHGGTTW